MGFVSQKYGQDVLDLTLKMVKEGAFDKEIAEAINKQLGHNISVVAFRQFRYRHGIGRTQDGGTPLCPKDRIKAGGAAIFDRDSRRQRAAAAVAEEAFRKAMRWRKNKFKDDETVPYEPVTRYCPPATHVETQSSAANAVV